MDFRRGAFDAQGGSGGNDIRQGEDRAFRISSAASRTDARHVSDGLQRYRLEVIISTLSRKFAPGAVPREAQVIRMLGAPPARRLVLRPLARALEPRAA